MKKAEKKEKLSALKAIDEQIVATHKKALEVLETEGASSEAYKQTVETLKTLTEARADITDSLPKRMRVDPTVWVAGGFSILGQVLLMIYDEEHVVPKWFKGGFESIQKWIPKVK